jgi:hypothetical protein
MRTRFGRYPRPHLVSGTHLDIPVRSQACLTRYSGQPGQRWLLRCLSEPGQAWCCTTLFMHHLICISPRGLRRQTASWHCNQSVSCTVKVPPGSLSPLEHLWWTLRGALTYLASTLQHCVHAGNLIVESLDAFCLDMHAQLCLDGHV